MNAMQDVLAAELVRVGDCLHNNRLSLKIDKSRYMIVRVKEITEKVLMLSGSIIEKNNSLKFLGVTIDVRLSLNEEVSDLMKIISACMIIKFQPLDHFRLN